MEELIQRIVAATGIDEGTARQAIGMILGFLKKHAPEGPVGDLLNAIPGGEEAVEENAGGGGGGLMGALGGLLGGLGGTAGSAGGLMALAGQLKDTGLDMDQIKGVGQQIFEYGGEQIGPDRVKEIAKGIPGLSQMIGQA
ncbi:MAG: DUF2267 domain-containing protein [Rhodoblastus sp.]